MDEDPVRQGPGLRGDDAGPDHEPGGLPAGQAGPVDRRPLRRNEGLRDPQREGQEPGRAVASGFVEEVRCRPVVPPLPQGPGIDPDRAPPQERRGRPQEPDEGSREGGERHRNLLPSKGKGRSVHRGRDDDPRPGGLVRESSQNEGRDDGQGHRRRLGGERPQPADLPPEVQGRGHHHNAGRVLQKPPGRKVPIRREAFVRREGQVRELGLPLGPDPRRRRRR
mmetsp:Transcript_18902/g.43839  ORF Transcript_18902/g.43839 Transcript_18902/m.43839 type:complete len:223 (+) Transcript_18902:1361-2029(+)